MALPIECSDCGHSGLDADKKCQRCGSVTHVMKAQAVKDAAAAAAADEAAAIKAHNLELEAENAKLKAKAK